MEGWPMEAMVAVPTMATEPKAICTEEATVATQAMEVIPLTHTVVVMET